MRLSSIRVGSGSRPVVLLHGYLGSGRNLWSLARAWSARDPTRTFLLLDLTGHGDSPPLPPNASLESMARDVLDSIRAEQVTVPVDIAGHSLGGRVAMAALEIDPRMVGEIVMMDIGPGAVGVAGEEHSRTAEAFARAPAHFRTRAEARASLSAELSRPIVDWLLMNLVPEGDGFGWRVDRKALSDLRPAIGEASRFWVTIERYGSRTRCIRGALSDCVSDHDARRMESLGCHVTTIADAGHFVHVDQAKALLNALLDFLPAE